MRNFIKITKLILLCPKYPNLGIWAPNFGKNNVRCQISIFKIGHRQNFVKRLESWYFFVQNTQIWALGRKFEKQKLTENSKFLQFGNFRSLPVVSHFLRSFRLVSDRFGSFRELVSTNELWYKLGSFKQNYLVTVFSKVIQYGYEIFKLFQPEMLKIFNLVLNFSQISNKAQNLYSVICSEINTVSIINIKLFKMERVLHVFLKLYYQQLEKYFIACYISQDMIFYIF